jgi:hypothetical protein
LRELLSAAVVRFGYPLADGGVGIAIQLLSDVKTRLDVEPREGGFVLVGLHTVVDDAAAADPEAKIIALETRVDQLTAALKQALAAQKPVAPPDDPELEEMLAKGRVS